MTTTSIDTPGSVFSGNTKDSTTKASGAVKDDVKGWLKDKGDLAKDKATEAKEKFEADATNVKETVEVKAKGGKRHFNEKTAAATMSVNHLTAGQVENDIIKGGDSE